MHEELDPKEILQLTDGSIGFEKMTAMLGECNPAKRHCKEHSSGPPLLHRDEDAYCQPFVVQDGFTCAYVYNDKTFSIHRHVFFGSLIEEEGVIATEPWYLALDEEGGQTWTSGFIERLEEEASLTSEVSATTYISVRVLGFQGARQSHNEVPKGPGAKIVRIPVRYDAGEGVVLGPQLIFKFKRLEGRKLEIDPDFTWRFPEGVWDEMPMRCVELIAEVHEAFICEDHDILRSEVPFGHG